MILGAQAPTATGSVLRGGSFQRDSALRRRAVVVYVFLLLAIRFFGRRELGQLTAFDIVVQLTLSNILQNSMIGNDNSVTGGMVGAGVLLSANRILIHDGKIQVHAIRREMLTEQDL
jgi:uncharacterized membrane protein YcaP (DUF421 family)